MYEEKGELSSLAELKALAEKISLMISGGKLFCLCGPLGAGKTTFVRYLVETLGGIEAATSPTYVLEHVYQLKDRTFSVSHWDLYRITEIPEDLQEVPALHLVRVVEWADKFPALMEQADFVLDLSYSGNHREYKFSAHN